MGFTPTPSATEGSQNDASICHGGNTAPNLPRSDIADPCCLLGCSVSGHAALPPKPTTIPSGQTSAVTKQQPVQRHLSSRSHLGSWSLDGNVLYILSSTGTQDTNLGDRFLYNAALSYRLTGSTSEKKGQGHMHLGADLPEPMYHGGPKGGADHSHEEPAAAPAQALDLVVEFKGEWHDKQVTARVTDQNSRGTVIYLSPLGWQRRPLDKPLA